ncbi:MAG: hypothetical protein WA667_21660 [Candidatus Nitrosopolaris sp.]
MEAAQLRNTVWCAVFYSIDRKLTNNRKRFGLIKSIGWNLEVLNRLQCANRLGLKITQYAISN